MKKRFIFGKRKIGRGNSSMFIFTMKDTVLNKEYGIKISGKNRKLYSFKIFVKAFIAYKKESKKLFLETLRDTYALKGKSA